MKKSLERNTRRRFHPAFLAATLAGMVATGAQADTVQDFYRGKSLNLLIGTGPGGGYDTYGRLLALHLGKHVPGNPTVVPRNAPGAAGVKVLNELYNVLPKDGSYIGITTPAAALEPLFGNKAAQFDTMKFTWLGNMDVDKAGCAAWHTSGITHFDDLFKREVTFGATGGTASYLFQQPMVLKELLGAKVKIINGYQGAGDINLAMRRGEVNAACGLFVSSAKAAFGDDIKAGNLKILVQFGNENEPFFGDAINIYDRLKSDEERAIARLIFGQIELTRPIMAPPDVPGDIAAALRKAFMDAMNDPALLAHAAKAQMQIQPQDGQKVAEQFAEFYRTPQPIIRKAMGMMGRN